MKQFITQKGILWTLLGALFYCLSFPTWNLFFLAPLAFFCFAQAINFLDSQKTALQAALSASFVIGIGGFHWIIYVMNNFGQLPWPIATIMLLLFCFIAAPQLVAFYSTVTFVRKKFPPLAKSIAPLFYAFLYLSFEYAFHFFKIFPETIAHSQIHWTPLVQSASIGGASIVGFFICYFGFSAAQLWNERFSKAARMQFITAIIIIGFANIWGVNEIAALKNKPKDTISFSVIQANIGDLEKLVSESGNANAISSVLNRYLNLSKQSAAVDLLLWPETAFPLNYPSFPEARASSMARSYASILADLVKEKNTTLLFGGYEQIEKDNYNSALLMNSEEKITASYRKKQLLMFGEYMPFGDFFPDLKNLNPQMGDFTRGLGSIPLQWKKNNQTKYELGISICYEALMPEYIRESVTNGAQIFINLTNDSWFGPGFEPYQHLQLARLRSIEHRIPMIRATNTGISTSINIFGQLNESTKLFSETILQGNIEVLKENEKTIYSKYGEWFALLSISFSILFIFFIYFTNSLTKNK